jgi:hypothetical protein
VGPTLVEKVPIFGFMQGRGTEKLSLQLGNNLQEAGAYSPTPDIAITRVGYFGPQPTLEVLNCEGRKGRSKPAK